ncbi:hypothetical protein BCR43DRAFT_328222 [Syncephalastrum racemosum]|uniref:Uncharacterized protein n=1 Tax=Syncephalastrum racemosum TaxID=13706 RepID=A0A1X2H7V6_SYNRA|nr:hypothetical protein BCR43DRAFT_328222 [Syncephalastrum racemosum]
MQSDFAQTRSQFIVAISTTERFLITFVALQTFIFDRKRKIEYRTAKLALYKVDRFGMGKVCEGKKRKIKEGDGSSRIGICGGRGEGKLGRE